MLERRPEGRCPPSQIQKELWGPSTNGLACEGRVYLYTNFQGSTVATEFLSLFVEHFSLAHLHVLELRRGTIYMLQPPLTLQKAGDGPPPCLPEVQAHLRGQGSQQQGQGVPTYLSPFPAPHLHLQGAEGIPQL